jgi:nucleoside-diphosphate-sugar epimerase
MSALIGIETEQQLDDFLSEPMPEVVNALARLAGDILLLGVGGKMGLSLARMARRASDVAGTSRRVIGVSRFSSGGEDAFAAYGIETIRCDLLDWNAIDRLPEAPNVIVLAGTKFGTSGDTPTTWATNCYLPGNVAYKCRSSRIVAFSTGNVYGLTPAAGGGSSEDSEPRPVGEYAMSCLGRERIFEYFSRSAGTPVVIFRLNYACDLRYGVLVDLATRVWSGEPIDLAMGQFNTIWQGDANAMALRALERASTPPWVVNVTGPEALSVRAVCEEFGLLMGRAVRFVGRESDTALLADARRGLGVFGPPRVSAGELIEGVARWVARGGRTLGKPTKFESRDGRF